MQMAAEGGKRRQNGFSAHLALIWAHLCLHLKSGLQYRLSFVAQAFAMFINNGMWLFFWVLYFARFPVVRGWEQLDVVLLWAILTFGYGLVGGIFGNASGLAAAIMQGEIDVHLAQPKHALIHILIARANVTAWGDLSFGLAVFLLMGQPTPMRTLLFVTAGVLAAVIFLAFFVISGSLTFYLGGARSVATELNNALIHFSSYPSAIFSGTVRVLLFSLVPAGFLNTMPVSMMRSFDPAFFGETLGAAATLCVVAWALFRAGLRRYESGNLIQLRG